VFARSTLSLPQGLFSRSLRSTICNPGHPHPMRTLRITNDGPEREEKQSLGEREERSCKHRIDYLLLRKPRSHKCLEYTNYEHISKVPNIFAVRREQSTEIGLSLSISFKRSCI